MTVETLLIIFVAATALSLVLQGFSFWRFSRSVDRLVDRIDHEMSTLQGEVQQLVEQANGVVEELKPVGRTLRGVQESTEAITRRFEERARDVDLLVGDLVEVGRKQAAKVDEVVTDTVEKFEQTTAVIQEDLLRPVVEVSSFVKGIRTGFEYLFAKKGPGDLRGRGQEEYEEEELFI